MKRPQQDDVPPYFRQYTDLVPDGDVLGLLETQIEETLSLFSGLSDEAARARYEEGKWSVKEVLGHLIDSERIFALRALWFARGDPTPQPGFDQDDYMKTAGYNDRPLPEIVEEMRLLRASNLATFRGFSSEAWDRKGLANDVPFRTNAVPWILAGHELHHRAVLLERYGL